MGNKPVVRVSTDEDGEQIHELLKGMGFTIDGLDWSSVGSYWLVAEIDGKMVGCIQIIAGKPIGWLEMLSYDQSLGDMEKARTVKTLVEGGNGGLAMLGCTAVMGTVPFELKSYKKVLKRRGAVIVSSGNIFAKRLR